MTTEPGNVLDGRVGALTSDQVLREGYGTS